MNKFTINKAFKEAKKELKLDYAITNTDKYGDCNSCVNSELADEFGIDSKGIYLKHWLTGMNAGETYKYLNEVYIGHDLTDEQGEGLINVLNKYFEVEPKEYDSSKSFKIKEKSV